MPLSTPELLIPPAIRTWPLVNCVAVCPYTPLVICPGVATKLPLSTVNPIPLLEMPPTVTTTLPFLAPLGTGTVIEPVLQLVGVAVVPLKLTVLLP